MTERSKRRMKRTITGTRTKAKMKERLVHLLEEGGVRSEQAVEEDGVEAEDVEEEGVARNRRQKSLRCGGGSNDDWSLKRIC